MNGQIGEMVLVLLRQYIKKYRGFFKLRDMKSMDKRSSHAEDIVEAMREVHEKVRDNLWKCLQPTKMLGENIYNNDTLEQGENREGIISIINYIDNLDQ